MPDPSARRSPWTTLSQRTVYENPWIRVEDHRVINPSGSESQYGKVCFRNIAVAVIALDEQDNVFLVGQHRYTLDHYSWELPMGGARKAAAGASTTAGGPTGGRKDGEAGEPPLAAAQRELREETGLSARRWSELMRLHTSNSITDELGIVYVAEDLTAGEQTPEPTEELAVRVRPFDDVVAQVLAGQITDAISVAAILRLALERRTAASGAGAGHRKA
jgi:8-oxo-dGTP pyrophosphatase MutT (NUDIX family)